MSFRLSGTILPDDVERDVWVADGLLRFEPADDAPTIARELFLLPGLVDAHAHLGLQSPAPQGATPRERIRASGRAQLGAGVLLVREPGGPDRLSAGLGPADGMPRVQTAGHLLSPPGTYIPGLARPVDDAGLPAAAEEEARASGFWVKVIGDFPGEDGRFAGHYRRDSLVQAVARAHGAGARVAIHASLPSVIDDAIEAGVDTIEHATMLSEAQIVEIAQRGIVLVPTLLIREGILGIAQWSGMPARDLAALEDALERQPQRIVRAVEAGVTVLAGTDAGMGPHGRIRDEIGRLLEAGLAPAAAIGAASWIARRYLGMPGIEDGAPADVVAYEHDPRIDPSVLAQPALIVLDGEVIGGTLRERVTAR
jgi:imidazolonepropionase-like amidohydrolase